MVLDINLPIGREARFSDQKQGSHCGDFAQHKKYPNAKLQEATQKH